MGLRIRFFGAVFWSGGPAVAGLLARRRWRAARLGSRGGITKMSDEGEQRLRGSATIQVLQGCWP
jgi:hypothetical protein